MSIKKAKRFALGQLDYLIEQGYCKSDGTNINISFLDEQLNEKKLRHERLKENAKKGGVARAKQLLSKRQAKGSQEATQEAKQEATHKATQEGTQNVPDKERDKEIDKEKRVKKETAVSTHTHLKFKNGSEAFEWIKTYIRKNPGWWQMAENECRLKVMTEDQINDSLLKWSNYAVTSPKCDSETKALGSIRTWLINDRQKIQNSNTGSKNQDPYLAVAKKGYYNGFV